MKVLVDFENLEWVQIGNGIRCKTFTDNNKTIRLVELSEGFIENGWCFESHTNYILEGEFTGDFDGEKVKAKKGDVVYIPPGIKHKAVLEKGQRVLMLDF